MLILPKARVKRPATGMVMDSTGFPETLAPSKPKGGTHQIGTSMVPTASCSPWPSL